MAVPVSDDCVLYAIAKKRRWRLVKFIVERGSFIIYRCVKDCPLNLMVLEQYPPLYFTVLWVDWAWLGGSSCDDGRGDIYRRSAGLENVSLAYLVS